MTRAAIVLALAGLVAGCGESVEKVKTTISAEARADRLQYFQNAYCACKANGTWTEPCLRFALNYSDAEKFQLSYADILQANCAARTGACR